MADLREVFEMTTNQMGEPDVDSWREQEKRQRNANRNKKIGAFALAAAVAVVAIAWIVGTSEGQDTATPANQPTNQTAKDVAAQFLHQLSSFNQDRAVSYLADDADLSGMLDLEGPRELRSTLSWWQATGFKLMPTSCEETGKTSADGTWVTCDFDFHSLRSDEIGKGPYSGSYFDLAVRDGEIVRMSMYFEIAELSPQMWEPFAAWVTTNYPEDVAAMYKPSNFQPLSDYRLTPESIRLWGRHTGEYVKAVRQGTA
jgi:hypothetical protein